MGKSLLLGFSNPILIVFRTHIKWDCGATWIRWVVDFQPYPTIVLRKVFSSKFSWEKKMRKKGTWKLPLQVLEGRKKWCDQTIVSSLWLCEDAQLCVKKALCAAKMTHFFLQWCNFPFQDALPCPKVSIWQFQWLQEASPYVQKSLLASGIGRQESWSVKKINVICHSVMHFQNDDSPEASAKYLIEALHSLCLHLNLLLFTHIFRCPCC